MLLTGIGGQGVQLAAQVLAGAAMHERRHVLLFGVYGGAMRGMNTDGTVVVGDGPIQSPPLLSHAWAALAMHDRYWAPVAPKVRDGGVVLVNDATFAAELDEARYRVFRLPATELAAELGSELTASMVLLGAFAGVTGIVGLDALQAGMREAVPAYRRQHVERNDVALRVGFDALGHDLVPAWIPAAAAS